MDFPTFQSLVADRRRSGAHRLAVPVYRRRSADLLTPVAAYLALREPEGFAFLLESVEGGERLGRYSFLGRRPYRVVEARGAETWIRDGNARPSGDGAAPEPAEGTVYEVMARLLDEVEEVKLPGLPRFAGGAVGFMGYDTVRLLERLGEAPPDDLDLPDAVWAFYDTVAAFDHVARQLVLMALVFVDDDTDLHAAHAAAHDRLDDLEDGLLAGGPLPEPVTLRDRDPRSNLTREAFEASVRKAKEHIFEGDIFQVVLSQRFALPFEGDPFNLYRALRQVNPSPYLFFLDFDGFQLAGSSPEVLVRVEADGSGTRQAEVLPIAGTRRRGVTPDEDAALEAELVADPKERAEHLMLVDLGRNDLGRACRVGSVRVERYATVERYARVMHLVSSVTGEVPDERRAMDVLAACFPAGTVSGAPKVRAMELIDELEPVKRGVYAGAVGYADFAGNTDTCIAIRTMLVRGQTAYVQAGAGIVADSDPGLEYEETRTKARALLDAMRVAADGLL
jgi:anthranilate synthase component 1